MQVEGSHNLDILLDELPELPSGYFSFPVDDFFENYVEELGQRGLQNGSSDTAPGTDLGQYDSLQPQRQPGRAISSAMSLDLPHVPSADLGYAQPAGLPSEQFASRAVPPVSGMPAIEPQRPLEPSGLKSEAASGVWGPQTKSTETKQRPKRNTTPAEYTLDAAAIESDDSEQDQPKHARSAGKTKRNAKQQVQNKQAQQRYRERRKQRFSEMEHAIDGLTSEVQKLHSVQSQNARLQAAREDLEARLKERELELEQLKQQMQKGQPTKGAADAADDNAEQRRKADEANVKECQTKAAQHVQALREFIDLHNLRSRNPTGEGVEPAVIQRLAEMVGHGCNTSQTAMRAEGVKVLRLMSQDVAHLSRINCLRQCNKWTNVLKTLQLTDIQKDQLRLMRQNHLRNLRQVYEARQQLNLRAMSLMLPTTEQSNAKDLDGKMACMSLRGYSNCARQSVELDEILNSIRENLRLEQKNVMEMNFVTMHRLMSPLQAALFLVEVHPAYCDALALANVLASQIGPGIGGELHQAGSGHSNSDASHTSSADKSDTCELMKGELLVQSSPHHSRPSI